MSSHRTDPHSPLNLRTEDYSFVVAYDAQARNERADAIIAAAAEDGWTFLEVHPGAQCDHCGTHLRYVAVMKHHPTRTLIRIGEQCLENRFERATAEFHRLRKEAKLDRERVRLAEIQAAWMSVPENAEAYEFVTDRIENHNDYGWNMDGGDHAYGVFRSIVRCKGEASERFVAAILRAKQRQAERDAQQAEYAAQRAAAPDAPEGVLAVTGVVKTMREDATQFGLVWKMLVEAPEGWAVWSTVPSSLRDATVGDVVEFTATLKRSDRDSKFAFANRPRSGRVLSSAHA